MDPLLHLRSGLNRLAFGLRSQLRWGRRYREKGAGGRFPSPGRFELLWGRFGLERLGERLSRESLLLNLAKIEQLCFLLDGGTGFFPEGTLRVLDVGSQNFVYAPALSLFFSRWNAAAPRAVRLSGIEVDPFRRYLHFHTRRDLAEYYASLVPPCEYLVGDFLRFPFAGRFHAITCFRPFLAAQPLVQAGLPLSLLRPEEALRRALELLEPQGRLILSFQSEAEAEGAQELFGKLGVAAGRLRRWDPPSGAVERRPQWLQLIEACVPSGRGRGASSVPRPPGSPGPSAAGAGAS